MVENLCNVVGNLPNIQYVERMMLICDEKDKIDELLKFYDTDLQDSLHSSLSEIAVRMMPAKKSAAASFLNLFLYNPEVAYVWGGDLAYSQLDIYRPYMANSKRKSVVFCKGLKGKKINDFAPDGVPVFHYEDGFAPHMFLSSCKSLHTGIYASNKVENAKYLRENPQMVHVLGLHGDSDKPSTVTRLSCLYDYVFAADTNATNRVLTSGLQITADRVLVIGGSPIENLEATSQPKPIKNIVYAPTWEGYAALGNFSSLKSLGPKFVEYANDGGELRFRPHPGTGTHDKSYKTLTNDLKPLAKCKGKVVDFNWSDVLIADVSGVVSEYLYSRKPIVIPIDTQDKKLEAYIRATTLPKYCYLWNFRALTLKDFLKSIETDPLWENRLKKREEMFFGAETQQEVTDVFESKISLCESVWSNRLMQKGHLPMNGRAQQPQLYLPTDPTLADLAKSVIDGKTMLSWPEG